MYKVYLNTLPMYDLDQDRVILSPVLNLKENEAGSFEFVVPPDHPLYSDITEHSDVVTVYDDNEEIFCGRILEIRNDMWKQKTVYCEGELGFFNDSVQRPAEYNDISVLQFLTQLIANHNAQVQGQGIDKTFTIGAVTVTDSTGVYKFTNYESTLDVIKSDLLGTYGGHLRIRKENGVRYLDYLADYPRTSDQIIQFGSNLLDFTDEMTASDIVTALIPLGAVVESDNSSIINQRVTISSVNDGKDYIYSSSAVSNYGWIFRTVIWDDVTTPSALMTKGLQYLQEGQFSRTSITVTAIDLHMMDVNIDKIKLLDRVRILSSYHGLDAFFPVTEMTVYLDRPSDNVLVLGSSVVNSMTDQMSRSISTVESEVRAIPDASIILAEASEQATQLIRSATNGHVYITDNATELLIMDTDDPATATKVWRWNLNGLGYSSTGYNGQYGLAITMDGKIVGSFITAGSITSDMISSEKIKAGKLSIEGIITANGNVKIDAQGNLTANNGTFTDGTFSGDVEAKSFKAYGSDPNSFVEFDDTLTINHSGGSGYSLPMITLKEEDPNNPGTWNRVILYADRIYFAQTKGGSAELYYVGAGELGVTGAFQVGGKLTVDSDITGDAIYCGKSVHVRSGRGLYCDGIGWVIRNNDATNFQKATCVGISTNPTILYTDNNVWKNGSSTTYFQTTSSSDKRLKDEVSDLTRYEDFFKRLKPVAFRYHKGLYRDDPMIQWGFYAQDVQKAFADSGLDWEDEELVVVEDDEALTDAEKEYVDSDLLKMNYQNMTALNTHMIQKLMKRIEDLEERLSKYEEREN